MKIYSTNETVNVFESYKISHTRHIRGDLSIKARGQTDERYKANMSVIVI